jgi:hypothetical protein
MYSALLIFCLISIVMLNYRNGDLNEEIEDLDERLTKLEKDAVKITFTPPYTTYDEKVVVHPNVKNKPVKKRKPKTVGEWEDEVDLGGHE